ncbi:MAG: FkbM family methyltransferase [Vicinamibacterales bacterium]
MVSALLPLRAWTAGELLRSLLKRRHVITHLKGTVLRHLATIARLRDALEAAELRHKETRARLDTRRHASLKHAVLRQLMPHRARHLPLMAHDAAAAEARDAHLQATSPAYHDALAMTDAAAAPLSRVEIDGLRWWVPIDAASQERIDRAKAQGFPYRAILQTREVAIGGVMLDVGANIGRTSIPRVMLGDVRAVYAAEPEPANYACLVRNVVEHRLRGLVMPDRVAIGERRGEARLQRSRYIGGHRVLDAGAEAPDDSVPVDVWSIDEWVGRLGIEADAVTFVKVDTQGSEVGVLRGAASLVGRRHISWLIEVDPKLLRRARADVAELVELLERHFSHCIDIGHDPGPRVRPTSDLRQSLAYLGTRRTKTDLLVFHAA